jgi:hypothetical protein
VEGYDGVIIDHIDLAPATLTSTLSSSLHDNRDYQELTEREKDFVTQRLFEMIGVDPETSPIEREYTLPAPTSSDPKQPEKWTGKATVKVYITSQPEEWDMFLHQIRYPDGKTEYTVAPKTFRYEIGRHT